jgi:phosphopantothenoylcysteine decarboxylase/phosphopantothenate--cysteine ligase
MGGDRNTVHLLKRDGADISVDSWPAMDKDEVATALVARIAEVVDK